MLSQHDLQLLMLTMYAVQMLFYALAVAQKLCQFHQVVAQRLALFESFIYSVESHDS